MSGARWRNALAGDSTGRSVPLAACAEGRGSRCVCRRSGEQVRVRVRVRVRVLCPLCDRLVRRDADGRVQLLGRGCDDGAERVAHELRDEEPLALRLDRHEGLERAARRRPAVSTSLLRLSPVQRPRVHEYTRAHGANQRRGHGGAGQSRSGRGVGVQPNACLLECWSEGSGPASTDGGHWPGRRKECPRPRPTSPPPRGRMRGTPTGRVRGGSEKGPRRVIRRAVRLEVERARL